MDEHFPGCEQVNLQADMGGDESQPDQPQLIDSIPWIDESLVVRSISIFDDFKSPGPDGLNPIVLKHLPPVAITVLVGLYTAMIRLHYTPLQWQQVHVLFLPKDGRDSYRIRPINTLCNNGLRTFQVDAGNPKHYGDIHSTGWCTALPHH